MSYEALNNKMLEYKDEMIESIRQSMRINSVRGEACQDAPYGVGPKIALDHMLMLGKSMGFKTGCADNRIGWIEYGEGEEMVGVLGHLDIVPAGDGWEHPAFGAEIHDGVLWGRGCVDDKGPIIGALYGLKAIKELNLPIDRRIRILFGTDEENGSSCAQYYVENGYEMPTIGFTPDAEFPAIFYEKGISFVRAGKKIEDKGNINIESLEGGSVINIVPGKCKMVVDGPLNVHTSDRVKVEIVEGKTVVTATGVETHASGPSKGINAIILLLEAVKDNDFGGDFQKMMDFILEKIGRETNGETLGTYYFDEETGETTLNLGLIKYDGEEMGFAIDTRYPKNGIQEVIDQKMMDEFAVYGLEGLVIKNAKSLYVPRDSELITKLRNVYTAETGDDGEAIAIGGGTYAKEFPNMVAFGPIFPYEESTIHKANERVSLDSLMKSNQIIAAAMYERAKKDN